MQNKITLKLNTVVFNSNAYAKYWAYTAKIITKMFLFFWVNNSQAQYSGGSGTVADPYQIGTSYDLKTLCDNSADWDNHFVQTANIVLYATDYHPTGMFFYGGDGFSPIGNAFTNFTGSYNGKNFGIYGLYSNRVAQDYVGMFGHTGVGANIDSVKLFDVQIFGKNIVGGLIGRLWYTSETIENCYVSGLVSGENAVGGLVGQNFSIIINSSTEVDVSGIFDVGGLCGNSAGSLTNCTSAGEVSGTTNTGGFTGYIEGNVIDCSSSSTVDAMGTTTNSIGGFVGDNRGVILNAFAHGNVNGITGGSGTSVIGGFAGTCGAGASFTNCFSTGNVVGNSRVGGFIGLIMDGSFNTCYSIGAANGMFSVGGFFGGTFFSMAVLNNCFAHGDVNGSGNVGGFGGLVDIATNDVITNSYSIGGVSGSSGVGGFIGSVSGSVILNNCFWDVTTSGTSISASGGTGLVTGLMQTQSTFTGATWDFIGETANGTSDIWTMGCLGYPVFRELLEPSASITNVSVNSCGNYEYTSASGTFNWTTSGTYVDTLTNSLGCDSIVNIDLTIENVFVSGTTMNVTSAAFCDMGSSTIELSNSLEGHSYYLLNAGSGTVVDGPVFGNNSSISFNTGTLASTQNFTVTGSRGLAVHLPGEEDLVRFVSPYYSYLTEITIEAWVNFDAGHYPWAGQGTAGFDHPSTNVWLWHSGEFFVNDASAGFISLFFPSLPSSGWTHVATVASPAGLFIYYNGVLVASTSFGITSTIVNNPSSVIDLGQDPRFAIGTPGRNSNNSFDNFRVWKKALTASEIAESMSTCDLFGLPDVVHFTNFDEGSGSMPASEIGTTGEIMNPSSNWIAGAQNCSCEQNFSDTITIQVNSSAIVFDVQTACQQYTWIDGNTYYASTTTPTMTLTTLAGCDSVVVLNLTINSLPDVTTSTSGVSITANETGATYQWIDCDNSNLPISGAINQSYTATANGNYAVIVNDGSCLDTSACFTINSVGIDELSATSLEIFPNPASTQLTINNNTVMHNVCIRNLAGQMVYTIEVNGKNANVNVSTLPNGVYAIETLNEARHVVSKQRLVISR